MSNTAEAIKILINKAQDSHDSNDAIRFSQAACNSANALRCMQDLKEAEKRTPTAT